MQYPMQENKVQPSFLFTVIIAVYNTQKYLEETISSVLAQDIGFLRHVQLILVNDGSTDDSLTICEDYAAQYPQNIQVYTQQNAGVAAARNTGLLHVQGQYLNFLDSDDKLSLTTLREVASFFNLHAEEVDIVTIPMFFFDAMSGEHWQNFKFAGGTRVADLRQEYAVPLMTVSASFIHSRCLPRIQFDGNLVCAEDAKVCLTLLAEKQKLGLLCEGRYWYRRRSGEATSLIQGAMYKKGWYQDYLDHFSTWAFTYYKEKQGSVPRFVQYTVMADLQWRFNTKTHWRELLSPQEQQKYKNNIYVLLQEIDDDIILEQKQLVVEHFHFLLMKKYNCPAQKQILPKDILLHFGKTNVMQLSSIPCDLHFLTLSSGKLIVEGMLNILECNSAVLPEIFLLVDGQSIPCQRLFCENSRYILDEAIMRSVFFRGEVALHGKTLTIRVQYRYYGCDVCVHSFRMKKFSPITKQYHHAYYAEDGWFLTLQSDALHLQHGGFMRHISKETAFLTELLITKKTHNRKAVAARLCYWGIRPFLRKKLWLVSDRVNKADDNGEAFFSYLREKKPHGIWPVFVLQRSSSDYTRLRAMGRVIEPSSWIHKLFLLLSDQNISSHADENVTNPFLSPGISAAYADIKADKKHIFLQHGVIKDDLSDWLCRYKKNIRMFVTTTNAEYESILDGAYRYSAREVKLVGLARHDRLYHDERNCITVMPTWRKNLTRSVSAGVMRPNDFFQQSEYFQFYNSLLNHERLLTHMKELGFTLQFMPHPNLILEIDAFDHHPDVRFLSIDGSYREIFAQSNLIVTDYSSVAFDFAYLRKPVVYAQFDLESFFDSHTYEQGYFDYERDGFGEVEYSLEATVDRLIEYLENGCQLKDCYRERIDRTFPFADQNNCERTFQAILKLDKEW